MADLMDTVTKTVRMQFGLMLGGVKGMVGMARTSETFLSKLAEQTKLSETDRFSEILDKTPNGFAKASREAISELKELPQEMLDGYRSVCKDD